MSVLLLIGVALVLLVVIAVAIAAAFAGGHREPAAPPTDEAFADFIGRSQAADREAPAAQATAIPLATSSSAAPSSAAPSPAAPSPAAPSPRLTHEQLADLTRGELERHGLIPAIKLLREHGGHDLRTTKEAVEYLQKHGTLPNDSRWGSGSNVPGPQSASPLATAPPALRAQVLDHLRARRKIEAIRLVRQHTGWGLKESKDYVESLE